MIDELAEYLASVRTLTPAEVDARGALRDVGHLSPDERFDVATHHTPLNGSEH